MSEKHSPLPWKRVPIGGDSMVVVSAPPALNQPETAIAYKPENGYSVALPFFDDSNGRKEVRYDFVCFSHADAALIVHSVNLLPELVKALERVQFDMAKIGNLPPDTMDMINAALAKARA